MVSISSKGLAHARAKTRTSPYGTLIPRFFVYELYEPCKPLLGIVSSCWRVYDDWNSPDKHLLCDDVASRPRLPHDRQPSSQEPCEGGMPFFRLFANEDFLCMYA